MSEELKRCPFCGSTNVGVFKKPWYQRWYATCNNCYVMTDDFNTKEYAFKAWNNRPSPWHTGTPTEEGWYLYEYGITGGSYATCRADTKKELAYFGEAKRWKKIEPYKESE